MRYRGRVKSIKKGNGEFLIEIGFSSISRITDEPIQNGSLIDIETNPS